MKALTLWQPWASLVAWQFKTYETRSWSTPYRGPLAIHAASKRTEWEVCEMNSFYRKALEIQQVSFDDLPFGAVLCIVNLVEVCTAEEVKPRVSQAEENFGDYSPGRYAWKLELVEVLNEPIPARGFQQLWNWVQP